MGVFLFVLPLFSYVCLRFPLSIYVIHAVSRESFQTRNLGSYKQRFNPFLLLAFRRQQEGKEKSKLWGLRPQAPMKIKRFKPALLSACREQQGGKGKRKAWGLFAPQTPNQDVGWSQWRDGSAVSFLPAATAALVRLT